MGKNDDEPMEGSFPSSSHRFPISNTKAIAWCLCIHLLEHVLAGGAPSLDASNGPWLIVFEYFCLLRSKVELNMNKETNKCINK